MHYKQFAEDLATLNTLLILFSLGPEGNERTHEEEDRETFP